MQENNPQLPHQSNEGEIAMDFVESHDGLGQFLSLWFVTLYFHTSNLFNIQLIFSFSTFLLIHLQSKQKGNKKLEFFSEIQWG